MSSTDVIFSNPSYSFTNSSSFTNDTPYNQRQQSFVWTNGKGHSLMEITRASHTLTDLCQELLELIFQQLQEIDSLSLQRLRGVDRKFNAVATPIVYRTLELNEQLVEPDVEQRYPGALEHIARHTKHIVIRSDLDCSGVRKILSCTDRLSSIRWIYTSSELRRNGIWLPAGLLSEDQKWSLRLKLFVEGLPVREYAANNIDSYIRAIPTNLLVSLKMASATPPLTAKLSSLKTLLMQSPRLEEFDYQDRGQGTHFRFDDGEVIPPLRHLFLKSYDWNHTKEVVRKHWDFSQLESLRLIWIPTFNFFKSISFEDLVNLRHLVVQDYSAYLPDERREATAKLYQLIRHHIRALEILQISCHVDMFLLDAVSRHGNSLRYLSIRDHTEFGDEERRCPTLQPDGLAHLARNLPHLHTLELDMDIERCDPRCFLRAIAEFQKLHSLTLHVQTVIDPIDESGLGEDEDYDAAIQVMRALVQNREQQNPDHPWKRITINVGEWRRVMIRRLSAAWRECNERGLFAERCFVLERNAQGQYGVREELCVESLSRRATPEL